MVNIARLCEVIAQATGAPERSLNYIARRLGEAALLPRGPRGRNAPPAEPIHAARLLIGLMAVSEGFGPGAVQVVASVERFANMRGGGIGFKEKDTGSKFFRLPELAFVEAIAFILEAMAEPKAQSPLENPARTITSAMGLLFTPTTASGYLKFRLPDQPDTTMWYRRPGDEIDKLFDAPRLHDETLSGGVLRAVADVVGKVKTTSSVARPAIPVTTLLHEAAAMRTDQAKTARGSEAATTREPVPNAVEQQPPHTENPHG